ncbi:MAG: 1-deoxy-D-xylulose-5-phosphate reductoisomerase [Candidatus Pelagibacter sp.]
MIRDIYILGSTGSVGTTTLKIINKDKRNFNIKLLTTNKNVNKILKQALKYNVNKIVIFDKEKYKKNLDKFKKKKINVYLTIKDALKKNKKKSFLTINAISGIDGLEPSLNIIKYTKNFATANKESIICGWRLLDKECKKNKTNFIPLDSEHFSIWTLLKSENQNLIKKIFLTASGGPFLNKKLKNIKNIKPKLALKHPNWKMGKKITIDSATMMNKIFEVIEASKIFDLNINKFEILIHPRSYVHAIVHFKNGLTKFLAHNTTMEIPITNAIYENNYNYNQKHNFNFNKLNGNNFIKPSKKNFPLLKILNCNFNNTYFEVILVSINDLLVKKYLENKISYFSVHKFMLYLIKEPFLSKFFDLKPKNIDDIKDMVSRTNQYVEKYLKYNDKEN